MLQKKVSGRQLRILLALLGLVGATTLVTTPALASQSLCGNYGDNPSFGCVSYSGYTGQSPWGYPVGVNGHNCTNYVTYRLWQNGVSEPSNLGNAYEWDNRAASYGIPVDGTPAIGAVAVWEVNSGPASGAGHVAYVEVVTSSYIDISEDNNGGTTMRHRYFVGQSDWPDHFIHFKDMTSGSSQANYQSFAGDFNGDGKGDIGLRDATTGNFYFKWGPNYASNQSTYAWAAGSNYRPIVGDWNGDNIDDIGLRDSISGTFYFKTGPNYASSQTSYSWAAGVNYQAFASDFNGDGVGDIGLRNITTGTIYFKTGPNYASNQSTYAWAAGSNYTIITGDFNGDATGDIGLANSGNGTLYFKWGPNYASNQSSYGWAEGSNYQPLTADWNGDGVGDIGLRDSTTGTFYFKLGPNYTSNQTIYPWAAG